MQDGRVAQGGAQGGQGHTYTELGRDAGRTPPPHQDGKGSRDESGDGV